MDVATSQSEVGIRELKNGLSKYVALVRTGQEFIVTDRGKAVARLVSLDASQNRLGELVDIGIVRPPPSAVRHRVRSRIKPTASVSDLVAEQRR